MAVDGIRAPMEGAHLAGVGAAHLQSPWVDGNIWDSWILEDLQIKIKNELSFVYKSLKNWKKWKKLKKNIK